jgi:hypothetical protein
VTQREHPVVFLNVDTAAGGRASETVMLSAIRGPLPSAPSTSGLPGQPHTLIVRCFPFP